MTVFLTVFGIVQGVGYRPFVAGLAKQAGVSGLVRNGGGIVEIYASGGEDSVREFIRLLRAGAPEGASVLKIDAKTVKDRVFDGFRIAESGEQPSAGRETPLIPPDLPMCGKCSRELADPGNRRYRYPFISCASCGPRFSILDSLPYDRENTSMRDFPMCPSCTEEYRKGSRRHAQTISCNDCGPQLLYKGSDGSSCGKEEALRKGAALLNRGAVLALKGVGGYQFVCSPFHQDTVARLRLLKGRGKKPFAVMYPTVESVRESCFVGAEEEKLLRSAARPIVLLRKKAEPFCEGVSGESRFIGAFLPYTGLHQILTQECGPLIATSGNLTSEPILIRDEDIFALDSPYLDGVLYNKREIRTPLDDSVSRVFHGAPQVMRRSRGYVPLPILLAGPSNRAVFAAGGDLKSCFCLLTGDRAYLSQYFGDLESYRAVRNYRASLERMERIFGIFPRAVACDLHPGYFSTVLARKEADKLPARLIRVQHHYAHAASVMAEHHLDGCIGVVFDGTGFGTDGTVWGGEFLLCRGAGFERRGHLSRITLCGGDSAARNAALTADGYRFAAGERSGSARFPLVAAALAGQVNTFGCSSMGRLFDAAAAIFGIRQENSYEGECPIALENAAAEAAGKKKKPYPFSFELSRAADGCILADQTGFARQLLDAARRGADREAAALGFHRAVAAMVEQVCRIIRSESEENRVALSGGVFANRLLLQDCFDRLTEDGFQVYVNREVPSNDGGICLGQAWVGANRKE
jgi:hydrogenase maturation protein HypF